ncbi:MAG: tRNA uridine-5-carboxymethylaminomethyl(34) synthesis GTPase MnmE, partial [Sphingomonas sp.]
PPRRAALRTLRDSVDNRPLDHALVLCFPGPRSATGEDLIELHVHGGRAVVAAVEDALSRSPGLRRANAGEFTRRALMSGRIDLAEAEGLGDLLMAETESQRRAAIASADGAVSRQIGDWTARLLTIAARVEALLDFADEDDVATDSRATDAIREDVAALAAAIGDVIENPPVERLRDGVRVVLAGAPNAGKSTLLNALVEREAAIVSPLAGTTRDRIEVPVVRSGIAYVFTDTAGLNDTTDDPIEQIGMERARQAFAEADIVILFDDTAPAPAGATTIRISPRADVAPPRSDTLPISARTGEGVGALWTRIEQEASRLLPRLDRLVLNRRQRDLCADAAAALLRALQTDDLLMLAEECRVARVAFDRITGAADTEDMLDALFGRFCIGK